MSKKLVSSVIFVGAIGSITNLNSKSMMPSLDRLKNKVDNALNGPKTSFKDFLEKTKNTGSKIFINGRDVESLNADAERASFENEIKDIESTLNNLYWCKEEGFAQKLAQALENQNPNILGILKEKFKERYPTVKSPLMTFAKDIEQEGQALEATKTKVDKAINLVKKFRELESKYTELAQKITIYTQTLNDLVRATDSL